jgi:hypothetical protein
MQRHVAGDRLEHRDIVLLLFPHTHSMLGFLQCPLQLFGATTATIVAKAFRFVRARVRAWRLGLPEQLAARLNVLAIWYASVLEKHFFLLTSPSATCKVSLP